MRSFAVLFAMAATAQAVQAQAAAPAAQAQASQEAAAGAAGGYHVVVVHNSESTSAEALVKVLTEKFNTDREKVVPLIEKIDKEGKAVVIAGSKDSCDAAALLFDEIGLKTEVRPLDATDMPSEYDNSDVVVGGAKQLTEALSKPDGILVAFHAPWCGHCKGMVEPLKEAATTLKAQGTVVMAIDGQVSGAVARQLGVRGYPTIMWLQLMDEGVTIAEHSGGRDAESLVAFAKAAPGMIEEGLAAQKAKEGKAEGGTAAEATAEATAEGGAAAGSKIGQSKVGKSKVAAKAAEEAAEIGRAHV